jgi:hypothetical protein
MVNNLHLVKFYLFVNMKLFIHFLKIFFYVGNKYIIYRHREKEKKEMISSKT